MELAATGRFEVKELNGEDRLSIFQLGVPKIAVGIIRVLIGLETR